MKRAYVLIRLWYRKWIRYINSPAAEEPKGSSLQYILLVAVTAAIVIKIKDQIEEKMIHEGPMKVQYERYYDDVSESQNLFD